MSGIVDAPAPTSDPSQRPPDEAFHIHGTKRRIAAAGLALVLFVSALDNSIVAVALPTIGQDLHSYEQTSWIVTAYLLTYTAFLPVISKLTDIVGRRIVLTASTLFFALWSGACGGARTMVQLIIFRALQGVGASGIYSGVFVTLSTMMPPDDMLSYTALLGGVFSASSVAGPLLGGVIVQNIHWGWLFFINLPISAIGIGLLWYSLHDPSTEPPTMRKILRRVDYFGSFCVLAFSLLFCTPLQLGGTKHYDWTSPTVIVPLALSVPFLPIFLWHESRHHEPLMPLRLFKVRNTAIGILFTLGLGGGFFVLVIFLSQRLQIVNGFSPLKAGVGMLPLLILTGVCTFLTSQSVRILRRYRPQMWFGIILGVIGAALLSTMTVNTPIANQYGYQALVGVSFGISITLSTMVIQFSTPRKDIASATGVQNFVRQIGGLSGIAIGTALLNSRVNQAIRNDGLPAEILEAPEAVMYSLSPEQLQLVRAAYSPAFQRTFIVAAGCFAAATIVSFGLVHFLPEGFNARAMPVDKEANVGDAETTEVKQDTGSSHSHPVVPQAQPEEKLQ